MENKLGTFQNNFQLNSKTKNQYGPDPAPQLLDGVDQSATVL